MNSTKAEQDLEKHAYNKLSSWSLTFDIKDVLDTCQRLRHKISVLNRRLQRTRTENKRLQKHNQELMKMVLDYHVHQSFNQ